MGKHFIIWFRGPDEVFTLPTLPVQQVARDGKSIEGIVLARRVVGLEIKHHIQVAHLGNLCITRDDTTHLVGKNGVTIIALPFLQVVRQGNTNPFCLQLVVWIDTARIIEHHETVFRQFFGQTTPLALWRGAGGEAINSALILYQFLPPLHIPVVDAKQGLLAGLPLMGVGDIILRPSHSDVQGLANSLITSSMTTNIGHPMFAFEFTKFITAIPRPVDECRKTTSLVHVPSVVLIRQNTS